MSLKLPSTFSAVSSFKPFQARQAASMWLLGFVYGDVFMFSMMPRSQLPLQTTINPCCCCVRLLLLCSLLLWAFLRSPAREPWAEGGIQEDQPWVISPCRRLCRPPVSLPASVHLSGSGVFTAPFIDHPPPLGICGFGGFLSHCYQNKISDWRYLFKTYTEILFKGEMWYEVLCTGDSTSLPKAFYSPGNCKASEIPLPEWALQGRKQVYWFFYSVSHRFYQRCSKTDRSIQEGCSKCLASWWSGLSPALKCCQEKISASEMTQW